MPKHIITLAVSCTLAVVSLIATNNPATASEDLQFFCGRRDDPQTGQSYPTTVARNRTGKRLRIIWQFKWANGAVSREQRCQRVSARLQTAYNNGSLNFIANSRINGQRVICTAYRGGGACNVVLLTLGPTDDASAALRSLQDSLSGGIILRRSATRPITIGSGEPEIDYALDYALDVERLIATAPVEVETSPLMAQFHTNELESRLRQGFDYFQQGNNDLALAEFTQVIELDPANKLAYLGRATIYVGQKQWNLALADFDRAIEFDSQFALAYFGRGIARLQVEGRESAISDLKTAAQLFREQNDTDSERKVSEILKELGE